MPEAFPDIPEPPVGSEPPLQALASANRRMLDHCAALRGLALHVGECGFDPEARAITGRLLRFFDHVLPQGHADRQVDLFPELIESMAGSDAVCLREITDGMAAQQHELWRLWLRLRPALLDLASGRSGALPTHAVDNLVDHCRNAAQREDSELLPMAARLLAGEQLERIGAAMRRRRSRPT